MKHHLGFGFLSCALFLQPLIADKTEDEFTRIYKNKEWNEGNSLSGRGSTLQATEQYRVFLQNFLKENNIQSVVDVGCGDWSFSKAIDWGSIQYTGYDVVKSVIKKNTKKYGTKKITFVHANGVKTKLPKADLLICKEVLQHLPNKNVFKMIRKFHRYKYCIITNDVDPQTFTSDNPDITPGWFRPIDLTAPPFNVKATKVLHYSLDKGDGVDMKQVLLIVKD